VKGLEGTGTDLGNVEPFTSPYDMLESLVNNKGDCQIGSDRYRDLVETLARVMEENPQCWENIAFLISTDDGLDFFTTVILLEAFGMQEDSVRTHEILLSLIQNPEFPMNMKRTAVSVLALAQEVPEQTVRFLQEQASQEPGLRDLALDVLARFARRCPELRKEIVRFLGETLQTDLTEGKTERAAEVLHAIGRTETNTHRNLVRSLANHECPRLRSAALITLGMSNPKSEKVRILHALRADKNPSVRLAALEALKLHPLESAEEQVVMEIPEDVLQDLRWTAQHDPNRDVRLRTLEIFHQSFEDLPSSVRETFQILAETDSCKNVRDWAKWYLEYGFYS
jgi:hypothetical protein